MYETVSNLLPREGAFVKLMSIDDCHKNMIHAAR